MARAAGKEFDMSSVRQPNAAKFTAVARKRRMRIKLRLVVVAAFMLWGGYEYWFVQRPLLTADAAARAQVAVQLAAQSALAAHLKHEISALHSDSYIATIAEQRYNLIKPGDILFSTAGVTKQAAK